MLSGCAQNGRNCLSSTLHWSSKRAGIIPVIIAQHSLTTNITTFIIIDINSIMRGGIRLGKGKIKQGGGGGGKRV